MEPRHPISREEDRPAKKQKSASRSKGDTTIRTSNAFLSSYNFSITPQHRLVCDIVQLNRVSRDNFYKYEFAKRSSLKSYYIKNTEGKYVGLLYTFKMTNFCIRPQPPGFKEAWVNAKHASKNSYTKYANDTVDEDLFERALVIVATKESLDQQATDIIAKYEDDWLQTKAGEYQLTTVFQKPSDSSPGNRTQFQLPSQGHTTIVSRPNVNIPHYTHTNYPQVSAFDERANPNLLEEQERLKWMNRMSKLPLTLEHTWGPSQQTFQAERYGPRVSEILQQRFQAERYAPRVSEIPKFQNDWSAPQVRVPQEEQEIVTDYAQPTLSLSYDNREDENVTGEFSNFNQSLPSEESQWVAYGEEQAPEDFQPENLPLWLLAQIDQSDITEESNIPVANFSTVDTDNTETMLHTAIQTQNSTNEISDDALQKLINGGALNTKGALDFRRDLVGLIKGFRDKGDTQNAKAYTTLLRTVWESYEDKTWVWREGNMIGFALSQDEKAKDLEQNNRTTRKSIMFNSFCSNYDNNGYLVREIHKAGLSKKAETFEARALTEQFCKDLIFIIKQFEEVNDEINTKKYQYLLAELRSYNDQTLVWGDGNRIGFALTDVEQTTAAAQKAIRFLDFCRDYNRAYSKRIRALPKIVNASYNASSNFFRPPQALPISPDQPQSYMSRTVI